MAVRLIPRASKRISSWRDDPRLQAAGRIFARYLPAWLVLAGVLAILIPNMIGGLFGVVGQTVTHISRSLPIAGGALAPLFTAEIDHWSADLQRWGAQYQLDPNLLATVMQIESCGHPTVGSSAGAQGLFQVMPFHFATGENMHDPDTNAMRGANFLNYCLDAASGNTAMAMACYNGGPSVLNRTFDRWAHETQRYYVWGATIYADAQQRKETSDSLQRWLDAGGSGLCSMAANALGIGS